MRKTDLSADLAGLRIDPAIMNAAGILSNAGSIKEMEGYLGAGVLKTRGVPERLGNETPIFCEVSDGIGLNAVGLPDPGYESTLDEVRETRLGIPLIVSVSGRTEDEIANIIIGLDPYVSGFELNYSCPNVKPEENLGITIGYDPERVRSYTRAARSSTKKLVFVKPAPALYIFDAKRFLHILETAFNEGADGATLINTIPGGMKIDRYAERPVLSAKFGGVSGKGIMPFGVGCVYTTRDAFHEIPIIGVGGATTAEDVVEYSLAGADVVQIGTELRNKTTEEKKQYLGRLIEDLDNLVHDLGYKSLKEMRGRAHGKK